MSSVCSQSCRGSYSVNTLSELRSVLSVMHGFFLFYSHGFSRMVSIILHCVILIADHLFTDLSVSFLHPFIVSPLFLHLSPLFPSQLPPPKSDSISSAVKVKTSSSPHPHPPPQLPPAPASLSPEKCGSGLPLTSQLTASLTSQCQPAGGFKIFLSTVLFIHTTHRRRHHCHLLIRLSANTPICDSKERTHISRMHAVKNTKRGTH